MRAMGRAVVASGLIGFLPGLAGGAPIADSDCRLPGVAVGDRVRVVSPELGRWRVSGHVAETDDGGLFLAPGGRAEVRRMTWCSIDSLEIARGTKRRTGQGARIGLVFPGIPLAVLGMAYFLAGDIDCEHSCRGYTGLAAGAGLGLAAGAGIGAAVGALGTTERWEPVRRDKVRIRVTPQQEGIAAAVVLRF